MTYSAFLQELFSRRTKKRSNLFIMTKLLKALGNPHLAYPTIHIAGTNGKGSVAAKIAAAFTASGYKTGLYTSPHLFFYEERITIDGKKIPQETVLKYDQDLPKDLDPNFFECTTCFAFRYFAEQNVDIAIIEAGLGGMLDSTNVIHPILSVITSIGMDHSEILGDSLEKIAADKAGIIKRKVPVILGPRAAFKPIFARAEKLKAPLTLVDDGQDNQEIAKSVLDALSKQFQFSSEAVESGLKCSLPCRFERRGNMILDVAHNPDGFARLKTSLERKYPHQKFYFVIGMNKNKDHKSCLMQIADIARHIYFVQADHPDSTQREKLAKALQGLSDCSYSCEKTVEEGIEKAKAATLENEILVICGSFYLMPKARESLTVS